MNALSALKVLVRVYYLKQIQSHEDFMYNSRVNVANDN